MILQQLSTEAQMQSPTLTLVATQNAHSQFQSSYQSLSHKHCKRKGALKKPILESQTKVIMTRASRSTLGLVLAWIMASTFIPITIKLASIQPPICMILAILILRMTLNSFLEELKQKKGKKVDKIHTVISTLLIFQVK